MLRAIIFDFDGLILDTEYPEYFAWSEVYQRCGLELSIAEWAARFVGKGADAIAKTPYDDLDERLGSPIDRAAIRLGRRARFAALMESEMALPGVEALLRDAQRNGLKVAVASSSPRDWVVGYLDRLGLTAPFAAICCGDEVERSKPAPDLYRCALAKLGVSSREAVAFEDSTVGVAAAKAAGLFCIAVPNRVTRHGSLAAADKQVASLAEVTVERLVAELLTAG